MTSGGRRRDDRAHRQPGLHFTAVNVPAILEEVRSSLFPGVAPIQVFFVHHGALACIRVGGRTEPSEIHLHQVLNTGKTPHHVFRSILVHELIHTVVRPAEIDGRWVFHPPEFWELERRLVPDMASTWQWIDEHLWSVILRKPKEERTDVRRNWASLLGRSISRREARLQLLPPHLRAAAEAIEGARDEKRRERRRDEWASLLRVFERRAQHRAAAGR